MSDKRDEVKAALKRWMEPPFDISAAQHKRDVEDAIDEIMAIFTNPLDGTRLWDNSDD